LAVRFHAAADGVGPVVGSAYASINVAADGSVRKLDGDPLNTIRFLGAVTHTEILPRQQVDIGQTKDLSVSGLTSDRQLVVTQPGVARLRVTVGDGVLRVNGDGSVTGLADGTALVVASIDGVESAPTAVRVSHPPITPRLVALDTNSLVYDPVRQRIWATVRPSVATGNSIVDIDPRTGSIGAPIFVGSEPDILALSDDASALFVGLPSANAFRRVDLTARTAGTPFSPGARDNGAVNAIHMAVQPGNSNTVAVLARDVSHINGHELSIFDGSVRRPKTVLDFPGFWVEWTSPNRLVSDNGNGLLEATVDGTGVTGFRQVSHLSPSFRGNLVQAGGRLYGADGIVIDATTLESVGRFVFVDQSRPLYGPAVDAERAFFLGFAGGEAQLHVFRLDTFALERSVPIRNPEPDNFLITYQNHGLTRWGGKGLAFRASGRVYLIDDATGP
jgi:hypothetical protein